MKYNKTVRRAVMRNFLTRRNLNLYTEQNKTYRIFCCHPQRVKKNNFIFIFNFKF